MAKQTRVRNIAAATTVDVTVLNEGKFQLGVGKLTLVSVSLARASQGPLKVNGIVEFDNQEANRVPLRDGKWIRSDAIYGQRDTWIWNGEIGVDRDDHILFAIRNDTSAAAIWIGGWVIV